MLRGIAKAGGDDPREDQYGIVVALSHLSQTLSGTEANATFAAAAEASATLLRVSKLVVFLRDDSGDLRAAAVVGINNEKNILKVAEEVAKTALESSSAALVPDPSSRSNGLTSLLKKAHIACALGVPMRVGKANVGAIVALATKRHTFTQSDIELIHVVASQAALAAWRARHSTAAPTEAVPEDQDALIRLADRKIQELSLVNRVSEAVNSTLDLEKLLDIALEQSMAAVGADAGSLMLISKETNKLEIVASRGLDEKWVENTCQEVGSSIAGWVVQNGESALISDARKDARFDMPFFRDSINSAAAVPLKVKGYVIGVLNVNTIQPDRTFDERDLQLLGTVANQMAAAIENARLYARVNRRTKQLDSLLHISRTITSTLNLDDIMRQLSDQICEVFQLDVCVLLLLDEISGRFRFGHGCGLKTRKKYVYFDLAAPLASRVKKTGTKLLITNINSSRTLRTDISKAEGFKAAICLPIKHLGKLTGVMVGFSKYQRVLPRSQQEITRPLGELAGVAIHNARMYRQKYKMAQILQHGLAPSKTPEVKGLDIGHKYSPARGVGGDYYDFIVKSDTGKLGIVLGDVAGSGVEAAEYTTMGKYVLRTYAREYDSTSEVLSKTNNMICEDTRTELFISLFYGSIDPKKKKLSYSNAGCEPAILYKAKDHSVHQLAADGMLLGIKPNATYAEQEVKLESGDVLMLHTDGLTEASVEGTRFGTQAVMDLVVANASESAQQIADNIHEALLEFGHGRINDDVALVVIKVS